MSSKPVTVWCVCRADGTPIAWTASDDKYLAESSYDYPLPSGFTVRKFKLVPVETKARGK